MGDSYNAVLDKLPKIDLVTKLNNTINQAIKSMEDFNLTHLIDKGITIFFALIFIVLGGIVAYYLHGVNITTQKTLDGIYTPAGYSAIEGAKSSETEYKKTHPTPSVKK